MIHILTIHWQTDKWIDLQLQYIEKNIKADFKIYAFLNDLSSDHSKRFFYSCTEPIEEHSVKLNLLADMAILHSSSLDDWLMFIDGDAFPIGDIVSFAREKLKDYPLLAIQRKENLGDMQPHPSFCITTIKFWKEIGGNWDSGYIWRNQLGNQVCDPGGILLSILNKKGISWYPMLRSNTRNLHPLWFGVYENLIYHHGAGFRNPVSRVDKDYSKNIFYRVFYNNLRKLPNRVRKVFDPTRSIIKKNKRLNNKVYNTILLDPDFYQYFIGSVSQ